MLLAHYDFKVWYYPGKSSGNADGLSHANQLPTEDTMRSSFSCATTPAWPDPPLIRNMLAASYSDGDAGQDDVLDSCMLLGP